MTKPCPLCGTPTNTSICAYCASDLEKLGTELPSPEATSAEVAEWAKANGVTAGSIASARTPPERLYVMLNSDSKVAGVVVCVEDAPALQQALEKLDCATYEYQLVRRVGDADA